jgi:hypothetical protein
MSSFNIGRSVAVALNGSQSITGDIGYAIGYTTAFPATENPISQGGIWVNGGSVGGSWNNVRTTSAKAFAASLSGTGASNYDDCIAHISSSFLSVAANQFGQGTIYKAGGYAPGTGDDHEVEILYASPSRPVMLVGMRFIGASPMVDI